MAGASGGPSLSDLRLGWQTAEEQSNLPLAAARMRQAVALFPGERSLRDNLAKTWDAMNRPDLAGALLAARGLSTGERGLIRRAIKLLEDAGEAPPAAGLYFRLLASDSRKSFSADQFALYRLYAESSPRPALSHLVMALERFPDLSATMEMELARILIWKGHYKKARRAIDRVIRSFPENRALLFQASDWFVEADQLSLALLYDERLVRLLPGDPQGLSLLIRDRRWAGQEGKTLTSYKRLLGLDPDNREALLYLGDNAYDHGFFRKAIGFYRRAVAGGDTDYALLYRLGMAFREDGEPPDGPEDVRTRLGQSPAGKKESFRPPFPERDGTGTGICPGLRAPSVSRLPRRPGGGKTPPSLRHQDPFGPGPRPGGFPDGPELSCALSGRPGGALLEGPTPVEAGRRTPGARSPRWLAREPSLLEGLPDLTGRDPDRDRGDSPPARGCSGASTGAIPKTPSSGTTFSRPTGGRDGSTAPAPSTPTSSPRGRPRLPGSPPVF
ncbi:MAG: hypothetical protein D084_Lepto4C00112G0001, partial [Leptospirillum sp. Group IV 'UBA BS']